MLHLPLDLLDRLTRFDVFDPAELGARSRITDRFPNTNNVNTYTLRNRGLVATPPGSLLSSFSMRIEGDLRFSVVEDSFGTEIGIREPGHPRYCLTTLLAGSMRWLNSDTDAVDATGFIYRGDPGQSFLSSDANRRFMLWIDAARLERTFESLADVPLRGTLAFAPMVDWRASHAAGLARLLQYMLSELSRVDGLFALPAARESLTDLLAQAMLTSLPHAGTNALARHRPHPVPRHLRRAEAFIHEAADQAIRLTDVAAAAGCSLGTLGAAFRQFRETTPLAALHAIRLERIREVLLAPCPETPAAVARRFGFSNASRFAAAYRRRFGEAPAETRARRPS
jgi:AraC-like DNA-binding protein